MNEYFLNGSRIYFENEEEELERKEEEKDKGLKDFDIATDKYKKSEVKLEITEYEIKD